MTKKLADASCSSKKLRKLTKSPDKLPTISELPDLGPLLPTVESPVYLELSRLLDELLVDEFVRSKQSSDAPFYGTESPGHSNLLKLPILIVLLAELPVRSTQSEHQKLVPLVRALLPNGFDIPAIFSGVPSDFDLEIVDALYRQ